MLSEQVRESLKRFAYSGHMLTRTERLEALRQSCATSNPTPSSEGVEPIRCVSRIHRPRIAICSISTHFPTSPTGPCCLMRHKPLPHHINSHTALCYTKNICAISPILVTE
ncbi:unnamed protein product [Protopolystoma xenopodis]|uniref:Uncharacterized protein n=1 Tax=Protopolystoma xenopodis TaxID=117903 RepID=A0A3S5AX50_9PLAT|nr:unnamed protein product [Protopolystoma xenopodis]